MKGYLFKPHYDWRYIWKRSLDNLQLLFFLSLIQLILNLYSLAFLFNSGDIFQLPIKIFPCSCKQWYSADQHDDDVCLCGYHRNIRHGACRAWRPCMALWHAAQKSWSGSMRGRKRRFPLTGATITPTWVPRENNTAYVDIKKTAVK